MRPTMNRMKKNTCVDRKGGQSDYPRTPQDTPGHSRTALFVCSIYYMSV